MPIRVNVNDGTIPFTDVALSAPIAAIGANYKASGTAAGLKAPVAHTWKRDGVTVATAREYTTSLADAYSEVFSQMTGATGTVVSSAKGFLLPTNRGANFSIALAGPANVNQPCSFTPSGDYGHPHVRFVPTWVVGGVTVGTNLFYTFTAADQGKAWSLTVQGVNSTGTFTSNVLSGTVGAAGVIVPNGIKEPALSLNLSGFNDYSPACPMIDWIKTGRFLLQDSTNTNADVSHASMQSAGYLDANGWLTSFPTGYDRLRLLWVTNKFFDYAVSLGEFQLTWEGTATLGNGNGFTVTNKLANSATIAINFSGNIWFDFTGIGSGANQLKNVKMIPTKWASLHAAGKRFNPDWTGGVLRNKHTFRFMDWQHTNSSPVVEFAELKDRNYSSYTGLKGGVPVDVLVDLANECRVNPWFCMPTLCSDAFVAAFTTYVKNNLAAGLIPEFQYSNEIWNSGIGVQNGVGKHTYFQNKANTDFAASTDTNEYSRNIQWIGRRCMQIAQIVTANMAGRAHLNTMDVQTVEGATSNLVKFLTTPIVQELFPEQYVAPYTVLDAIAGTNYVGTNFTGSNRLYLDPLMAAPDKNKYIRDFLLDPAKPSSIPAMKRALLSLKSTATTYGLKLHLYEGGFHIIQHYGVAFDADTDAAGPTLYAFDDSPEAQECIDAMFTVCAQVADGPYMQFSDIGSANKYGTWFVYTGPKTPLNRGRLIESRAMTEGFYWGEDGSDGRYQRT